MHTTLAGRFPLSFAVPLPPVWAWALVFAAGLRCCGFEPDPVPIDEDGDGFAVNAVTCGGAQVDCNDDDAAVFPGAEDDEGDGVDQNCDGVDGEASVGEGEGEGEGEGQG